MLDLSHPPVISNPSHPFELEKANLDLESLARIFYHGMGNTPTSGIKKPKLWDYL